MAITDGAISQKFLKFSTNTVVCLTLARGKKTATRTAQNCVVVKTNGEKNSQDKTPLDVLLY
jgi:hypothetical protein